MAETGTPLRITLVTEGDPGQLTGGYLYQQRMAAAAQAQKCALNFVSLRRQYVAQGLVDALHMLRHLQAVDAIVVDSIAAAAVAPSAGRLGRHLPIVALVHQQPGGVEHHPMARSI